LPAHVEKLEFWQDHQGTKILFTPANRRKIQGIGHMQQGSVGRPAFKAKQKLAVTQRHGNNENCDHVLLCVQQVASVTGSSVMPANPVS